MMRVSEVMSDKSEVWKKNNNIIYKYKKTFWIGKDWQLEIQLYTMCSNVLVSIWVI
jgi:hypothetical protein